MTGIEKIVEKIREESLNRCDAVIAEAKENAGEILFEERKKAEKEAEKIISEGKKEALKKENAARSAAETISKTRYLEVKNAIVNDIIAAAFEKIEDMSDEDYFSLLLSLCEKNVESGEGTMFLSKRDLERVPKDFEETVNSLVYEKGAVRLSKSPMNIENGFVLVYGDIEVNCTLRAVFDEKLDSLRDALCKELFTE
ncbi:MAG: V-type ATP synthase subunit E [Clostridia bacterium]|nr:V-type ATP synthase subunit E [Clostridia bacterium]